MNGSQDSRSKEKKKIHEMGNRKERVDIDREQMNQQQLPNILQMDGKVGNARQGFEEKKKDDVIYRDGIERVTNILLPTIKDSRLCHHFLHTIPDSGVNVCLVNFFVYDFQTSFDRDMQISC